jgi:putative N6-adenine-specific DNA methylase
MENNFKMVAKTFFGFEEILAKELQMLGAQDVEQGVRMVSFKRG